MVPFIQEASFIKEGEITNEDLNRFSKVENRSEKFENLCTSGKQSSDCSLSIISLDESLDLNKISKVNDFKFFFLFII